MICGVGAPVNDLPDSQCRSTSGVYLLATFNKGSDVRAEDCGLGILGSANDTHPTCKKSVLVLNETVLFERDSSDIELLWEAGNER